MSSFARRRIAGAGLAVAIHLTIGASILRTQEFSGDHVPDVELEITYFAAPQLPPADAPPEPRRRDEARTARTEDPSALPIPNIQGPPTEIVASAGLELADGKVVDYPTLINLCRTQYPDEIPARSAATTVVMRVFVMPDGRIAQGTVSVSSGDEALDQAAFRCVQAFANVEPAIQGEAPAGAWQTITTVW